MPFFPDFWGPVLQCLSSSGSSLQLSNSNGFSFGTAPLSPASRVTHKLQDTVESQLLSLNFEIMSAALCKELRKEMYWIKWKMFVYWVAVQGRKRDNSTYHLTCGLSFLKICTCVGERGTRGWVLFLFPTQSDQEHYEIALVRFIFVKVLLFLSAAGWQGCDTVWRDTVIMGSAREVGMWDDLLTFPLKTANVGHILTCIQILLLVSERGFDLGWHLLTAQ